MSGAWLALLCRAVSTPPHAEIWVTSGGGALRALLGLRAGATPSEWKQAAEPLAGYEPALWHQMRQFHHAAAVHCESTGHPLWAAGSSSVKWAPPQLSFMGSLGVSTS